MFYSISLVKLNSCRAVPFSRSLKYALVFPVSIIISQSHIVLLWFKQSAEQPYLACGFDSMLLVGHEYQGHWFLYYKVTT